MRVLRAGMLGCVIAMIAGAGVARAAAWVTPAKTIYTGAGGASTVRDTAAAEDQAGNAFAAWWDLNTGNLDVSERPAGGSFPATAQVLANATYDVIPQIAVDAAGNVIVIWLDNSGVLHGAQQAPGGTFQPLTLPATANALSAQIAAGGDGTVIVAWVEQGPPNQIKYSLRRSGGAFGAAASLPGSSSVFTYSIAADQAGDIGVGLLTRTGPPGTETYSVYGGYSDHNGSGFNVSGTALDTQTNSPDPMRSIGNIGIAMSPGGDAIVTWTTGCSGTSNPCGLSPPPNFSSGLFASIRPAGQATLFSTKASVATSTASPNAFWTPGAAFDGSGNVVMAWGQSTGSSTEVHQSQASVADGAFSPPTLVASAGTGAPYAAMGSLASGQIVLVYVTGSGTLQQAWGALRPTGPKGTAFAAGTQISAISGSILEQQPRVAPQGNDAFVDWALYNIPEVQGVGYSGNAPTVTITAPTAGTAGQPVSVSASALGIWTPASVGSIDFGDGSSSATAAATHTYTAPGTYTVAATATDGAGNTGTGTAKIVVAPAQGSSGPTGPSGPTGNQPPPPRKCVVPKLKGKTLAGARRALKRAHCRLGRVTRPKRRKHSKPVKLVVVRQSRTAGHKFSQGTKVNVRLGRPPHKKHRRHPSRSASVRAITLPAFPL
jgi:hypothetical protein